MKDLPRKWMLLLSIVAVGYVFVPLSSTDSRRTSVFNNHTYPAELPCRETMSALMHDRRAEVREEYDTKCRAASYNMNGQTPLKGTARDIPELKELRGTKIKYAVWKISPQFPEASAWTEDKEIEGLMFVTPKFTQRAFANLTGDFVSFVNFAEFAYGHYNNHNLPTIAWLKEQVPETTRLLLHDSPLAHNTIHFLDPEFYKRVVWLPLNQTVNIHGSLTVPILTSYPMQQGEMRPMVSLRKWVYDMKGTRPKNYVVFYSRKGAGHDRVLADEEAALRTIRTAMLDYGLDKELIVFTGKGKDGSSMSMEAQYDLFRSAHTIIGPHGAGLLGNLAWTDPYPETCKHRTKVLEFINGIDSAQVQANTPYVSSFLNFRKWPIEWHVLTYTADSTSKNTHIDDWALQDALKSMWGSGAATLKKT